MSKRQKKPPRMVGVNEHGRRIGEWHHDATLSDAEVEQLRELHEDHGWSYGKLAEHFGISKSGVRYICTYAHRAQTPVRFKPV